MTSERDEAGEVSETAAIQDTGNSITSSRNESGGHTQPVRYATEGDVAIHKTEIRRLYMEEELPLKELVHIMKEKHSFHATYGFQWPIEYTV